MTPFERELTDEELTQVTGAGSSDQQAPLTLNFQDVDHISFSSSDNGDLKEQVFFVGSAKPTPTTGS